MLVAQQLKHLHGLEFAFLLVLSLHLLVKFWGCKVGWLLQDADGCTHASLTMVRAMNKSPLVYAQFFLW